MPECERRPGVLLLTPDAGGGWMVVEVDAVGYESFPSRAAASAHKTATSALGAAFDVLTLLTEERMPAMHEHVQESVREFVRALEARGYDRESAMKVLLDLVDRHASDPPKAARSTLPSRRS